MASFVDELRDVPNQEQMKRRMELQRALNYEKQREEQIINSLMKCFEYDCREAAKNGKRSIDYKPPKVRHGYTGPEDSSGAIQYSDRLTFQITARLHAREKAESLIPRINERLDSMGFQSYSVSTIAFSEIHVYTCHYIGFRIKASW
ncbi:MAG: hypothetical protein PUD63_01235 [Clostridia bacterium]|nr:hypothetical protein [Clostridia bacterium]MDD6039805.1 hypothetical protein [Clostridia bacterium]